ncbi:ABC transporter substrate-binding protein [Megamonas funiformis]|jgi:multiple sugar transport system substrate-binding protein|uniref:ABC transporter substrate-binding protein n=1 Tax=Megamonas funiformis TaxID=437897 RepID=UPI00241DCC69|nr:sugar ABC transporter substrate-binding protein [Megamonas funiformis]
MIKKVIISFIAIVFIYVAVTNLYTNKVVIHLGIFVGNWELPNGNDYKVIDDAIARFEKLHPNVEIEYESGILKSDYSLWLANKIVNGEEPDVFMIVDEDFNTLSSLGVLKDLTEEIENDKKFNKDDYYESTLKAGQYEHKQYALPYESNPMLMFVNKTLLEKENIPIPENDWTLDDFYNICQQVTKDTNGDGAIDQYGCYNFSWLNSMYSHGIRLFDEDGKECFIDQDEAKEAVIFVEKLNKLNQEHIITKEEFNTGKVAFAPMSFAQYRTYKPYPWRVKKFSDFEWDCIKMPLISSNDKGSEISSLLMGISSRSKNADIAWEFLKMLTYEKETQKDLYKYSQGISSLKSINKSEDIVCLLGKDNKENQINVNLLDEVMNKTLEYSRFKKYNQALNLIDIKINDMIRNKSDIDIGLLELQKDINKYLNE